MPQSKKVAAAGGADRISALPDALIHHVMSFLPAREAVATCVLARRWRHLWKSMPVLRVTGPAQPLRKFLDHFLLLRERLSLEACRFNFRAGCSLDDVPCVNLWFRHALLCQVRNLRVGVHGSFDPPVQNFPLDNLHVVSQYLEQLELHGLTLCDMFTDFSSCPVLKELRLTRCNIDAGKIYSRSLKRLKFYECLFPGIRTHVSTPGLILLQMIYFQGRTPFYEDMPVLCNGIVKFHSLCDDYCANLQPGYCGDDSCQHCYGVDDGSAGCVLLKGLSAARDLKLMAEPEMFLLKRDLRWCPTFSKLKTLLLTAWCLADDHRALICILQHSPVLQELTLKLHEQHEPANMVPSRAIYDAKEQSFASKSLRRFEVKCGEVNKMVHNVLKALVNYGIPLQIISIQQKSMSSE